jgi:hypothetical protein
MEWDAMESCQYDSQWQKNDQEKGPSQEDGLPSDAPGLLWGTMDWSFLDTQGRNPLYSSPQKASSYHFYTLPHRKRLLITQAESDTL